MLTSNMKRESPYGLFKRVQFALPGLETINNAAYWDYQRERVLRKIKQQSIPQTPTTCGDPKRIDAKHNGGIPPPLILPEV